MLEGGGGEEVVVDVVVDKVVSEVVLEENVVGLLVVESIVELVVLVVAMSRWAGDGAAERREYRRRAWCRSPCATVRL